MSCKISKKDSRKPIEPFAGCLAFVKLETLRHVSRTALGHKVKIFQVTKVCRWSLANMTQRF